MKVMETIPYRRTKLHIKTIPKGTLLFRYVKKPIDDLRGPLLPDGKRCITPHFHTFFYPNPFVAKLSLEMWSKDDKTVKVYILTKDVKILWLLKPSKYSRIQKNTKRSFIKQCSKTVKGCLPKDLVAYNPCFSDTLVKKHPDIVGFAAIAPNDARRLRDGLSKVGTRVRRFFISAKDEFGSVSVPEIALSPLTLRPSHDVITTDTDVLENNYKVIDILPANKWDILIKFMERHAVFNPNTFFYTYKE